MASPGKMVPTGTASAVDALALYPTLSITQKKKCLELICGCDGNAHFDIIDPRTNQDVLHGEEDTNVCVRFCCGPYRPWQMQIKMLDDRPICSFERPFRLSAPCCCLLQELHGRDATGASLGTIRQEFSLIQRKFVVYNSVEQPIFDVCAGFCSPWTFNLLVPGTEQVVGVIRKLFSGLVKEALSDADNFSVTFPVNADPKTRALLLGLTFLIDSLYFENKQQQSGVQTQVGTGALSFNLESLVR
jgi:hypothetical protein